jgi:hypothetical protein
VDRVEAAAARGLHARLMLGAQGGEIVGHDRRRKTACMASASLPRRRIFMVSGETGTINFAVTS